MPNLGPKGHQILPLSTLDSFMRAKNHGTKSLIDDGGKDEGAGEA